MASVSTDARDGPRATVVRDGPEDMSGRTDQIQIAALDRVYDLRRNCQLNEAYYGCRLASFRRLAVLLEVTIVLGSGASGISGWVIWTTAPHLGSVWAAIAAVATVLAAIKPAIQLDKAISRYSALFSGYRELSLASSDVVEDIAQHRQITHDTQREITRIRERYRKLAEDDYPKPSARLVGRLQEEVNRRTPLDGLWYPEDCEATSRSDAGWAQLSHEARPFSVLAAFWTSAVACSAGLLHLRSFCCRRCSGPSESSLSALTLRTLTLSPLGHAALAHRTVGTWMTSGATLARSHTASLFPATGVSASCRKFSATQALAI